MLAPIENMDAAKTYFDPDGRPISITAELAQVFDYSAALCATRDVSRSYASVLLCFALAESPLCAVFKAFLNNRRREIIAQDEGFRMADLAASHFEEGQGQNAPGWDANLAGIFSLAMEMARRVSDSQTLDVRHLMAAYIYDVAPERRGQLERWNLTPAEWASWFQRQITVLYPDEVKAWREVDGQFGQKWLVSEPRLRPYIANDLWTTDDKLGHEPYAYALYRFLLHKDSQPPLTVGVHAPWGAGKTSFMRMVREHLDHDPEARNGSGKLKKGARLYQLLRHFSWKPQLPELHGSGYGGQVTIWFNAWQYQSTEQIWAGLAHAIIYGIANRFAPVEREKFWLRLQWSRRDAPAIRMNGYFFAELLVVMWCVLFLTRIFQQYLPGPGSLWGAAGLLSAGGVALATFLKGKLSSPGIGEFFRVLDHHTRAGVLHQITEDLRHVFEIIQHAPVVIFIDDLDRCSPQRIRDTFEGINLFISGGIHEHCTFILGMDPEIICAALDSPQGGASEMSSTGSLGRRYMDKFIQLPFALPPLSAAARDSYLESLSRIEVPPAPSPAVEKTGDILPPHAAKQQRDQVRSNVYRAMNARFEQYDSDSYELLLKLKSLIPGFLETPRDLKRCVNLLRFNYFLSQEDPQNPDLESLVQQTVLSLKWPHLLARLEGTNASARGERRNVHEWLVSLAAASPTPEDWVKGLEQLMPGIKVQEWTSGDELYRYLRPAAVGTSA